MTRCRERRATAACADCGLRTQIRSNCWIRGLTAKGFFLFKGRDVAITMNSVKILHAVRSAITAIAELLVNATYTSCSFLCLFLIFSHSLFPFWPRCRGRLRDAVVNIDVCSLALDMTLICTTRATFPCPIQAKISWCSLDSLCWSSRTVKTLSHEIIFEVFQPL